MPENTTLVSRIYLRLNGAEVQKPLMRKITELVVDQHAYLPDVFTIRLTDSDLKILEEGPFDLTQEIEIQAGVGDQKEKVTLLKGEITALEPYFGEGRTAELVVRGYDKSHRLYRQVRSRAFLNKKDSDLASDIAAEHNLSAEVGSTQTVYDHIYQHNQSDLEFLRLRAWRIGYECFVRNGTLYFRPPQPSGGGPTLAWGKDLLSFEPRMTLAEQVDEVVVKGWDVSKKEAIVGRAANGKLYPAIGESKDGAQWAGAFGPGKLVIVDQPVHSQAEADSLASARLDERSGAFVQAEGRAFRRPDICAGETVKLQGLGKRFSGDYLVTRATHVYTPRGLETQFCVQGARTGLVRDSLNDGPPLDRWPGVVVGLVTNTDDPQGWGRVKLKFPWLAEDAESDWARLAGPGAGPEAGLYLLPEVGDEVLVVFAHGDFSQPYVIGGLWNGRDGLPPESSSAPQGEGPLVRTWRSRTGHRITVHDTNDKKMEIVTADGRSITLDDQNRTIAIKTPSVEINLEDNKLSVEAATEVRIKAGSNLKLEAGGNLDIQASGQVTVKGATINLN